MLKRHFVFFPKQFYGLFYFFNVLYYFIILKYPRSSLSTHKLQNKMNVLIF